MYVIYFAFAGFISTLAGTLIFLLTKSMLASIIAYFLVWILAFFFAKPRPF